jgi:hypothetical protein
MRFFKYDANKSRKKKEWHAWFAWWPVKVKAEDGDSTHWAWLETVERRGYWFAGGPDSYWCWKYRCLQTK